MMFVFEIFGILTASYLVVKCVGEAVVEIRNEGYRQANLKAEGKDQRDETEDGRRPKLRVVGWPEGSRRRR